MANITPYNPGDLPNRAVGTPGVDQAAGAAEESLAKGALTIRNAEASSANQALTTLGAVLGTAARGVGVLAHRYEMVKNAQKQQIAEQRVINDGYAVARDMDSVLNDLKGVYADRPEELPKAMEDYLDKAKEAYLSKYSDPLLRTKAEGVFVSHANSVLNGAENWALEKGTQLAHAAPDNIINGVIDELVNVDTKTDLASRLLQRETLIQPAEKTINSLTSVLGREFVESKIKNLRYGSSAAVLQSAIVAARLNDDPKSAIEQLQGLRAVLANPGEFNLQLRESDLKAITNALIAAEEQQQGHLENAELTNQVVSKNAASSIGLQAKIASESDLPTLENLVQGQLNEIQERIKEIRQNPLLSDKARLVLLRGQNEAFNAWKEAENEIIARREKIAAQAKQADTAQAQAVGQQISVNLTEQKITSTRLTEARQEEQRAQKAATRASLNELNKLRDDLRKLITGTPADVYARRSDAIKQAAKISDQAYAYSHIYGTITPQEADHYSREMENLMKNLAALRRDDGFFGLFSSVKQLNPNAPSNTSKAGIHANFWGALGLKPEYVEARGQQEQILKEIQDTAAKMLLQQEYTAGLVATAGFTPEQRALWDEAMAKLQSQPLSPRQFEYRLQQVFNAISHSGSASLQDKLASLQAKEKQLREQQLGTKEQKAETTKNNVGRSRSALVPPPPPTIPTPTSSGSPVKVTRDELRQIYNFEVTD